MVNTNEEAVRDELQIEDKEALTPKYINRKITDANNTINVDDELAERYLTCFMIAKALSWQTMKSMGDGISLEVPKPEYFHELYINRLRQLGEGVMVKINDPDDDTEVC